MVKQLVKKMVKIGICGKQNSGKNTVATILSELFSDECLTIDTVAFADPIKKMAELMFPWADTNGWYGASHLREMVIPNAFDQDSKPLTYRKVLIDIGSLGRAYDHDHWVKVFDATQHDGRNMVITPDVRFRNEFEYLRANGFFIIKLVRGAAEIANTATETAQDEIQHSEFDEVVFNDGTIDTLKEQLAYHKVSILAKTQ